MKKRLAVITSVVLSAGLLFGCGSGSTSATKAAGTGDKETQAAGGGKQGGFCGRGNSHAEVRPDGIPGPSMGAGRNRV